MTREELALALAERTRQSVRPTGGRREGWATTGPEVVGDIIGQAPPKFFGGIGAAVSEYEDPTQGTYRAAPIMEAATSTMGMGGLAAFTPGMSGALGSSGGKLFNYSKLHEVPDVPQFALERYAPKHGVSERVADLTASKKIREKMLEKIEEGTKIGPGAEKFYNNDPLRQAFIEELGKKKGPEAFARYMDYVAATSPRSAVPANVRNASYYYTLDRSGKPMPAIGDVNPQPYGHMAQRLHQQNAQQIAREGGWNVMQNPKPASFSQNLQGNFAPVTVDAHAFKLPAMLSRDPEFLANAIKLEKGKPTINPSEMFASGDLTMKEALSKPVYWTSKPNKNEYAAMEQYYQQLAREAGLDAPAMGQAAAWAGGGPITGLKSFAGEPFLQSVENRAILTAKERGITPAEALSQFIRGKAPLLSIGASAGMGSLAAQDQYQQ